MRRGGRVFLLHRNKGLPWFLHDGHSMTVEVIGAGVKVISPPIATGYSAEKLHAHLLQIL